MNTRKKFDGMNKGLRIKYLNIILLTLILSFLINSFMYMVFYIFSNSWNLSILIITALPFIFGGIISGYMRDGKKGVWGGIIVGATSTVISINITLLIYGFLTLPSSEWSFYMPIGIIYTIPLSLGIGAVLGLIGSLVGIMIKKVH